MRCPKCSTTFSATPDAIGILCCPSCGARLRSRTQAIFKAQAAAPAHVPAASGPKPKGPAGAAELLDKDSALARAELPAPEAPFGRLDVDATIPRGLVAPHPAREGGAFARMPGPVTLERVLAEVRAIREIQAQILALLQGRPLPQPGPEDPSGASPQARLEAGGVPVVLVIDDQPETRSVVVAALQKAPFRVKTAADGHDALAAIAMERPDAIVLEVDLQGSLAGQDVARAIQANRDWKPIPIILHTRTASGEGRSALDDDVVAKGPGSPEALVACVQRRLRAK